MVAAAASAEGEAEIHFFCYLLCVGFLFAEHGPLHGCLIKQYNHCYCLDFNLSSSLAVAPTWSNLLLVKGVRYWIYHAFLTLCNKVFIRSYSERRKYRHLMICENITLTGDIWTNTILDTKLLGEFL